MCFSAKQTGLLATVRFYPSENEWNTVRTSQFYCGPYIHHQNSFYPFKTKTMKKDLYHLVVKSHFKCGSLVQIPSQLWPFYLQFAWVSSTFLHSLCMLG